MKSYAAIDLKSFYASCECIERGLDPLRTNLVVADASRTEKTICLAVTPPLKAQGVPSRPRLFEAVARVKEINSMRKARAPQRRLIGSSWDAEALRRNPSLRLDYITARPRMALYMEYSRRVYEIYLKYFSPDDIHVYSVDEVFIDLSGYLTLYKSSPEELCSEVISDIYSSTGLTAACGIGSNLYLAKVAMDILAKHAVPDKNGVRMATLTEQSYRTELWAHRPITDFWRVGRGYAKRLASYGMFTMGDVALMSKKNEGLLYKLFGVNAELLIDHAWGYESCSIKDIKAYRPENSSISSSQVLSEGYSFDKAELVLREMAKSLTLDIMSRKVQIANVTLTVGYEHIRDGEQTHCDMELAVDFYGRLIPRPAHGSFSFGGYTSSQRTICDAVLSIYRRTVNPRLEVRRMVICASRLREENSAECTQLDFFTAEQKKENRESAQKEQKRQRACLDIKRRYGKNAILYMSDFLEGATTIERNSQIGGHRA